MTPAQRLELITFWRDSMIASIERAKLIRRVLGLEVEGTLNQHMHVADSALTALAACALGDRDGWLEWFWLENDFGAKRHTVAPPPSKRWPNPKPKAITTPRLLLALIDASNRAASEAQS